MNEPIVKREIRARAAPTFSGAWLWAFWGGLAAMVAAGAVIMFIESLRGQWLAVAVGSVVFWYILGERKQVHDEQLFITNEEWPAEEKPEETAPQIQPWIQISTGTGGEIRQGRFNFTASQWAALGQVFVTQKRNLSRENVAPLRLFTNITKNWGLWIEKEFMRMRWFNEDKTINQAGIDWFNQFLSPAPHRNGTAVVMQQPTATDDDDDDGRGGA